MLGMLGDKKKMVSIILGEKPSMKEVPNGLESDIKPAMESYAQDLISAIENKDAGKLASAFKEMMYLCEKEEDYTEGESESEME